jgi:hypothetical protein
MYCGGWCCEKIDAKIHSGATLSHSRLWSVKMNAGLRAGAGFIFLKK